MAEEIQREQWESHRLSIYAQQNALERTIPRYLSAMFGKKGAHVAEPPPIPTYDEVIRSGKIGGSQSSYFTKFDSARPEDTFRTDKWWENKTPVEEGTEYAEEVAYGGALTYVPAENEEGFEGLVEARERLQE